ncbi:Gfo/Idh/MocA family oxidoreductase [Pelomonas sp. SE-A7]|uniref:Gfo/Idh/MocA family protein n=1 Tax=Pelomonas sp. SE-A7 TaxID=3054953 RepID=UPI00259CC527|nr:Gfo/Idh/MocA family oxidoreductase [Pelomonas sp. SE-A7]MDM4767516.1 Gfo/Idh/MocA family oxidoreductase [Pelomonas sp. SE-A7]
MTSTPTSSAAAGLRVAVIGLGRMGLRHVEAARRLGMDVCGAADTNPDALKAVQAQFGVAAEACFTDAYQMLATVKPAALVIATTAPTHAPFVLAAVEQGTRHILCEKPLATSLAEADAMLAACERSGTRLAVNHQMRFMAQYTQVKALIGSEELGPLASILVAGSNFGLAMNASHYFEMFRYLSDQPVAEVQAWFEDGQLANPRGPQFEDRSGRLLARSAAGPSMFIDFSASAGWGLQVVYICRHGQIVVDELNGDMRIAARQAQYRELPTTRYGMPVDIRVEQIEPADTVVPTMAVWQALLAGEGYPSGADGAHALGCLVAAHASHEAGGRAVRLDDPALPRERVFKWA